MLGYDSDGRWILMSALRFLTLFSRGATASDNHRGDLSAETQRLHRRVLSVRLTTPDGLTRNESSQTSLVMA